MKQFGREVETGSRREVWEGWSEEEWRRDEAGEEVNKMKPKVFDKIGHFRSKHHIDHQRLHTHTHTQPFYCSSGICPGPPG